MATIPHEIRITTELATALYHPHDEARVKMALVSASAPNQTYPREGARVDWGTTAYECPQCQFRVELDAVSTTTLDTSLDAERSWFHGTGPRG